jgi:hypothetical protein
VTKHGKKWQFSGLRTLPFKKKYYMAEKNHGILSVIFLSYICHHASSRLPEGRPASIPLSLRGGYAQAFPLASSGGYTVTITELEITVHFV